MTFSATQSGKQGTATSPFDQIAALEQSEADRVAREMAALEAERKEVARQLQEKQEREEQDLRDKAMEELKAFREKELTGVLGDAKARAEQEQKTLEQSAKKNEKAVVDGLIEHMMHADSFLSTAA